MLTLGSILPQTGSLAFLGPPEFAGFDLAIQEINEAGGVLGQDVVGIEGDSGDTTTNQAEPDRRPPALGERRRHHRRRLVRRDPVGHRQDHVGAGVTMFSPANTSTELSDYADKGLYFRTAPPDVYQGDVLGQFVVDDGNQTVGDHRTSTTPTATASPTQAERDDRGVRWSRSSCRQTYDPAATSFDSEVDEIAAADPDAILVIGFNESSRILRTMVEKGVGPHGQVPSTAPTATSATPSASTSTPATDSNRSTRRRPGPSARAPSRPTRADRQARASVPR